MARGALAGVERRGRAAHRRGGHAVVGELEQELGVAGRLGLERVRLTAVEPGALGRVELCVEPVADQDVGEAQLPGALPRQGQGGPDGRVEQGERLLRRGSAHASHAGDREVAAEHGGRRQGVAGFGRERVEPAPDRLPHAGGQRSGLGRLRLVSQHPGEGQHEEGVALRSPQQAGDGGVG